MFALLFYYWDYEGNIASMLRGIYTSKEKITIPAIEDLGFRNLAVYDDTLIEAPFTDFEPFYVVEKITVGEVFTPKLQAKPYNECGRLKR